MKNFAHLFSPQGRKIFMFCIMCFNIVRLYGELFASAFLHKVEKY